MFLPGRDGGNWSRIVALLASLIALIVAVVALVRNFAPGETALRFEETVEWIPQFGISYHLGADGLNITADRPDRDPDPLGDPRLLGPRRGSREPLHGTPPLP
ncbi:MAG: hypothetical protein U0841_30030 [Chloroflexia bacterium]